ncbi:hypothetical protein [Moorena sp. SIO3I6]|uniref:hypothetical protein n=1 Tax=Moorena sp. SIO3I6 TaxID=2607831 RepID=UPI0013F8C860|nr:hypothetical protein [Moorena sp. SIO3I6]NEP20873.1 hypothetical protein [Moorena sp. SIO3I6]
MGIWGDGEIGRCSIIGLIYHICFKMFPTPDSRLPIPVPLLGGERGGFRFPTPYSLLPIPLIMI